MKELRRVLLMLSAVGLLSGCVAYSERRTVEFDEASRVAVKFESADAADAFHSKVSERKIKQKDLHSGHT